MRCIRRRADRAHIHGTAKTLELPGGFGPFHRFCAARSDCGRFSGWPDAREFPHHARYFRLQLSSARQAARPLLCSDASLLTLSYLGAEKVVPNYNTMGLAKASLEASVRYLAASLGARGIRVNGISAGPIKTLAASGIQDFSKMLDCVEANAPLHRNVTIEQVGNTAAFLLSDLAAGISAEIIHVDSGFHAVMGGMNT